MEQTKLEVAQYQNLENFRYKSNFKVMLRMKMNVVRYEFENNHTRLINLLKKISPNLIMQFALMCIVMDIVLTGMIRGKK